MATRCCIKIDGVDYAKIYKHWDGYPSATLGWLKDFNEEFTKERGEDPTYKFAQLLRSSTRDSEKYGLDNSKFTGWGVYKFSENIGEEYEYTLKNDGSVTVKEI